VCVAEGKSDRTSPTAAGRSVTVSLQHVSKSYGTQKAVIDLSLDIYAGEVLAFLGPNGAGKTTTLKLATGLLRPDTGGVTICGYHLAREGRQAKQLLAYIPDQPFVYDKLTGHEFIEFTREMYGVPPETARERLASLRDRLAMDGFLDQLAETFSHGMKQKVALAAALIHDPKVLIVDEPMVGLDPRTIRVTKTMLRDLAARGGTVFMSTHTLEIAEQVADRLGIIHRGRLIALGTLAELRALAAAGGRLEDIFLHLTDGRSDTPAE